MNLRSEFSKYASSSNDQLNDHIYHGLMARYTESHRHYHNIDHLCYGLNAYYELFPDRPLQRTEFFAWMYHDAIYDASAYNNENKSALLFLEDANYLGFNNDDTNLIFEYIIATKIDDKPISIINDMDLAGLGSLWPTFNQNTINIRKEYMWVSEEDWKEGRSKAFQILIDKKPLYFTQEFNNKYHETAIENMKHGIELLEVNMV